jgi:hypothetical protein
MLKKAFLLLLVCLLALPAFACKQQPEYPVDPPTPTVPTTPSDPDTESVLNKVYAWNFLTDDGLDKNNMTEDEIKAAKDRGTLYWEINNAGVLYLKGICTVAPTFYDETDQPWCDFTSLQRNDAGDSRPVLKHVIVEPTVMALPDYAFYKCAELETVTLSMTMSTLPPYCFAGCEMLNSVTGGMGLSTISDYALSSCSLLQRLEITTGLTDIGTCAFEASCDKLGRDTVTNQAKTLLIHFRGTEDEWLAHKAAMTVDPIGNAAFDSATVLYVN